MKKFKKSLCISVLFLTTFILWTIIVRCVDVQQIGPQNSSVGLGIINQFIHNLTGVNFNLYNITDWLGLVPIVVCLVFGILGLTQCIRKKSICKVDSDLLILGGFYLITIAVYLLFENIVINYRPVLINGYLEASYPSSTTMLVMCVMPTSILQLNNRIKNNIIRNILSSLIIAFIAFMVIGRLFSGVHWFSDIIGGALLSTGLVTMYYSATELLKVT